MLCTENHTRYLRDYRLRLKDYIRALSFSTGCGFESLLLSITTSRFRYSYQEPASRSYLHSTTPTAAAHHSSHNPAFRKSHHNSPSSAKIVTTDPHSDRDPIRSSAHNGPLGKHEIQVSLGCIHFLADCTICTWLDGVWAVWSGFDECGRER